MYKETPEQRAENRRLMKALHEEFYMHSKVEDEPVAVQSVKEKSELVTKSPATKIAENQLSVIEMPPDEQVITKPENVIEVPEPVNNDTPTIPERSAEEMIDTPAIASASAMMNLPKTVKNLIGKTFGNVEVLSYNVKESLIPRGKKQIPLPHVDCKCKCGNVFVVNAYRVSCGQTKSCGCDSKRKKSA